MNFKKIILAGDLNSNSIWDKTDRWWNHSNVVNDLGELNIHSIYHHFYKEKQGNETRPTFYLQRNKAKPYHIDFIFATNEILSNMSNFEIGEIEKWLRYSDHLPLVCEIINQ